MAEFCLDCLRKLEREDYDEREVALSNTLELCEACGKYKRVVVSVDRDSFLERGLFSGGAGR